MSSTQVYDSKWVNQNTDTKKDHAKTVKILAATSSKFTGYTQETNLISGVSENMKVPQ